jgi:hypothetical protein
MGTAFMGTALRGMAQGVAQGPPPPASAKAVKCRNRMIPRLEDITEKAGILFTHSAAPTNQYIVESMSGGVRGPAVGAVREVGRCVCGSG